MYHLQNGVPHWTESLLLLPDYCLVKAVSNMGFLMDAKQKWIAGGRDPHKLFTLYRHFDVYTAPDNLSWTQACAHWDTMYRRWVSKSFIQNESRYIDFVSESNEYTAENTWQDADDKKAKLQNMRAAAWVWQNWYRGKEVTVKDDDRTFTGVVPSNIRLTIMAGPVGNRFPVEVFDIAEEFDCLIDYHAYTLRWMMERPDNDFRDLSGLYDTLERQYGRKVDWIFGESGVFLSTFEGWRHPNVLNGDQEALVEAIRVWVRDMSHTAAYLEGRLHGFALFTQHEGAADWTYYNLQSSQLNALAPMLAQEWHPAAPGTGDSMDTQVKTEIRKHTHGIDSILWLDDKTVPFDVSPVNKVIQFYHKDGSPFAPPVTRNVTWTMHATAKTVDMLLVFDQAGDNLDWWVRASDVYLP